VSIAAEILHISTASAESAPNGASLAGESGEIDAHYDRRIAPDELRHAMRGPQLGRVRQEGFSWRVRIGLIAEVRGTGGALGTLTNHNSAANGAQNDSRRLGEHALAERAYLDARHLVLAQLLRRRIDLGLRASTLHQNELATVAKQGSGERQQLAERADRASCHLIELLRESDFFRSRPHDLDVPQPELPHLIVQPGDATLHRLDEDEVDIRSCDRQDQSGKPGARADIADSSGTKQRRDDGAVQDVSRPQPRELQRPDEPEGFTVRRQIHSERATDLDLLTEQLGSLGRLRLEDSSVLCVSHRSFA
jgi:hypothetical protein